MIHVIGNRCPYRDQPPHRDPESGRPTCPECGATVLVRWGLVGAHRKSLGQIDPTTAVIR